MRCAMPPLEEVLLLSSAGDIISGSMSNLFLGDDSGLFTPALGECGVAGVMRQLVCAAAERSGSPVLDAPRGERGIERACGRPS